MQLSRKQQEVKDWELIHGYPKPKLVLVAYEPHPAAVGITARVKARALSERMLRRMQNGKTVIHRADDPNVKCPF